MSARTTQSEPAPVLEARHAIALCVGVVVGAGIFRTPALVAANSPGDAEFLGVWLIGGLISIVGALCYAELASTYPHAGGDYHYLERAYGHRLAFLYGWARLTVIQTGSLALLAYIFADYLTALWPLGDGAAPICAAALVVALTGLNWLGVQAGASTQLWLTGLEIVGLSLVIVAGFVFAPEAVSETAIPSEGSLGLVLVFVLLTFGGWSEIVYVSAELRGSRQRIAAVMIASLVIVTALYLLVNWAYLRALGLGGIAGSDAVATELMGGTFGRPGAVLISLLVAVAALTSANATAITGARTAYALGQAMPRLRWLGRWDGQRRTPGNALIAQGGIALLLVLAAASGRDEFGLLVEFTAPVFWGFLLLVGFAQILLRHRHPDIERPFRTPWYPLLPALFCATNAYLLYSSLMHTGASALLGLAVVGTGALLLPFLDSRKRR
ncbi:amino acid transporter [Novosphingobium endophyticum]|uniref:Amino acid transporter n=1 Tax=Novosphingobium endophyticum TaxID=1955250 RepID=A0A916X5K5_9SPHN|nr:amino acid permease [Novosphingobium endophyticum]GGC09170.1 amino acid transporter [Novosphingobium endophyticum]